MIDGADPAEFIDDLVVQKGADLSPTERLILEYVRSIEIDHEFGADPEHLDIAAIDEGDELDGGDAGNQGAIDRVGMGVVEKVIVRFEVPINGQPVLVALISGPVADELMARSDQYIVDDAVAALTTMFP